MNTGTPDIGYYSRLVTNTSDTSMGVWIEAVECLRKFLVKEIFPHITMRSLREVGRIYVIDNKDLIVSGTLEKSQGFFHFSSEIESFKDEQVRFRKFWGLTRDGQWVKGKLFPEQLVKIIHIDPTELINIGVHPTVVAYFLKKYVNECLEEKQRCCEDLYRKFIPCNTFAGVAEVKGRFHRHFDKEAEQDASNQETA